MDFINAECHDFYKKETSTLSISARVYARTIKSVFVVNKKFDAFNLKLAQYNVSSIELYLILATS